MYSMSILCREWQRLSLLHGRYSLRDSSQHEASDNCQIETTQFYMYCKIVIWLYRLNLMYSMSILCREWQRLSLLHGRYSLRDSSQHEASDNCQIETTQFYMYCKIVIWLYRLNLMYSMSILCREWQRLSLLHGRYSLRDSSQHEASDNCQNKTILFYMFYKDVIWLCGINFMYTISILH